MTVTLHCGDNRIILRDLADNSVDAIVCDPPYELGFMGKRWDSSGIAYDVTLWAECLRVLKPGGHLIAFGGTRTYHRMTVAIEDAGFEIRDCIAWIYGSGFPKSLDVSKAIDKNLGITEWKQSKPNPAWRPGNGKGEKTSAGWEKPQRPPKPVVETSAAKQWAGFGTALKPAHEPAVLARKPLTGTVANNVMTWGTGALNIDGCRVGTETITQIRGPMTAMRRMENRTDLPASGDGSKTTTTGRWPANLILDEEAAALLDAQSGGASRFFYTAKASRAEREAGLEGMEVRNNMRVNAPRESEEEKHAVHRANHHPTVKPLDLIRYLVRLVTPPGGVVLDPFMGSGSTGCAAVLEGMHFVGIDITPEYVEIAQRRIAHHAQQATMPI